MRMTEDEMALMASIAIKMQKDEVNDVLDQIREEIMKLQTYKMFEGEDTVYVEHKDVLAIIDKYKAENMERQST